jgi:hypothetical protein
MGCQTACNELSDCSSRSNGFSHAEARKTALSTTTRPFFIDVLTCYRRNRAPLNESFPNERTAHLVQITGFWIDEHDVTNAEFAKFVAVTGYVKTAERPINWEDSRKELPHGTPKPDDSALAPGSPVFLKILGQKAGRWVERLTKGKVTVSWQRW